MVDPKALLERARESDRGEAYASVAKGAGFRIGLGVRTSPRRDPVVFIEIVLDPFPDRPRVSPERLADQGDLVRRLRARGYTILCDDDSTILCERAVGPTAAAQEVQAVRRLLVSGGGKDVLRATPGKS